MEKSEIIKKAALENLSLLKKICEENDITYYLVGGSLIGALRHGGFIPWDDDIDVAMPRKEYERFLVIAREYINGEKELVYMTSDPNYKCYHAKIVNNKVKLLWPQGQYDMETGVWIDIFPLDGLPNCKIKRWGHIFYVMTLKMIYKFSQIDYVMTNNNERGILERGIIWLAISLRLNKYINERGRLEKIDKCLKKYDYDSSRFVWDYAGRYGIKEIMPKYFFQGEREVTFEDIKVKAPLNSEKLLRHFYGDYLKEPPIAERNGHKVIIIKE